MIERKAAGEEIAIQPETEEAAPVPDLMSALKASLDAVRERTGGDDAAAATAAEKPKRKRAPAKSKAAAKK
jgi:DNA end-binding protein Ku